MQAVLKISGKEININVDSDGKIDVSNLLKENEKVPDSWGNYVIVRSEAAGVFACYIEKREGKYAVIRKARRLWYWSGAASLSQLAVDGVAKPDECKFPCEVDKIEVMEIAEIIHCTEKARKSIADVPVWAA